MKRYLLPILSFILAAVIFGGTSLLAQNPSVQFQQIYNLIQNIQNQLNNIQTQIVSSSLPGGATSLQFLQENQAGTAAGWATLGGRRAIGRDDWQYPGKSEQ